MPQMGHMLGVIALSQKEINPIIIVKLARHHVPQANHTMVEDPFS